MALNVICSAWLVCLASSVALGDEPKAAPAALPPATETAAPKVTPAGPAESEPDVIRIYHLKYADPNDVAEVLAAILPVRVATEAASRSVVVVGPKPLLDNVERILSSVDSQPTETQRTVVLPVPKWMSRSTLDSFANTFRRHVQVHIGEDSVVVSGTSSGVEQARNVFQELVTTEQPDPDAPGSLQAEFYFLRAHATLAKDAGASVSVPSMLEPVVAALAESGILSPSLLAPMTARFDQGRGFSQEGTLPHDAGTMRFSLRGDAKAGPAGKTTWLRIAAKITVADSAPGQPTSHTFFEVETELTVPSGDFVVLASAPMCAAGNDDIIVLVVRLTTKP